MGERGAPPDPQNRGLYCRHCDSKYCSCDGEGNVPESIDYDSYFPDEGWTDHDETQPTPESTEPKETDDSDDLTALAAAGAIAVGIGVAIGFAIKWIFE